MKVILASGSPRRRELLGILGVSFDVLVPDVDETPEVGESAESLVERLAVLKAETVARQQPDAVVLAADTIVVLGGEILGKPEDKNSATEMLKKLSGSRHYVYTGMAVVSSKGTQSILGKTEVEFVELSEKQIQQYIDTGEPQDKAGAYAIQGIGSQFVRSITGSYTNVVGLDLVKTKDLLMQAQSF